MDLEQSEPNFDGVRMDLSGENAPLDDNLPGPSNRPLVSPTFSAAQLRTLTYSTSESSPLSAHASLFLSPEDHSASSCASSAPQSPSVRKASLPLESTSGEHFAVPALQGASNPVAYTAFSSGISSAFVAHNILLTDQHYDRLNTPSTIAPSTPNRMCPKCGTRYSETQIENAWRPGCSQYWEDV
jgi:hypothetical protein